MQCQGQRISCHGTFHPSLSSCYFFCCKFRANERNASALAISLRVQPKHALSSFDNVKVLHRPKFLSTVGFKTMGGGVYKRYYKALVPVYFVPLSRGFINPQVIASKDAYIRSQRMRTSAGMDEGRPCSNGFSCCRVSGLIGNAYEFIHFSSVTVVSLEK